MAEVRLALSDSHRVEGTGRCKSKTRTDESTDEQGINAVWETKNPHYPKESTLEARVGIERTTSKYSETWPPLAKGDSRLAAVICSEEFSGV
jgi:hypothetical protein